jgi:hypothetical protein
VQCFNGGVVDSFDQMWDHANRNLVRIEEHFGVKAVQNLISNMSKSVVISLYSGLGGAEAGPMLKPDSVLEKRFIKSHQHLTNLVLMGMLLSQSGQVT